MMNYFLMRGVGIGMGAGISQFFQLGDYHVSLGLPLFFENETRIRTIASIHFKHLVPFRSIVAILFLALLPFQVVEVIRVVNRTAFVSLTREQPGKSRCKSNKFRQFDGRSVSYRE